MLHFLDPYRGVSSLDVMIKIVLAALLGAMIGIERSYKNRPAGARTHMLVSSGAAIASMTALYFHLVLGMPTDITRLSAAVVSGLSFLGVGTIIVTKNYTVKGLTTAAGLWVAGIVGLCAGAGFYEAAVLAGVIVLLTEGLLSFVKDWIPHDPLYTIEVLSKNKKSLDEIMRHFKKNRMSITNLRVMSSDVEGEHYYLAFLSLKSSSSVDKDRVFAEAKEFSGIVELTELEELDES
ncbi:MAG: MgtC/SapB family protein [Oscillospiraceae bacterium]|nr:MgtC/SapB family protein [Oscillospiraceae bacterium]